MYDTGSQDLVLRWDPKSDITNYNIQISTCGDSMLMEALLSSSCSVSQLSGVNLTEYGLLLVEVQSCVTVSECGVDLPGGVSEKNIVAISMQASQ